MRRDEEGVALSHSTPDGLDWDLRIRPRESRFALRLGDLWRYRDLLMLFVRRDIVVVYKQTILGPAWFFIQPVLTTATFVLVFGNLARLSTDGVPKILFYLAGVTIWNYFSELLTVTSKTFTENAGLFGKVYFPRLVLPLSKVISGLAKLVIQLGLFLAVLLAYVASGSAVAPNRWILLTPLLLLLMAGLGFGLGVITSSLTTKYRDLAFLIAFGVQLFMYGTPVVFPVSAIPQKYRLYVWLNPLSSILEAFKHAFLGSGELSLFWLGYSALCTLAVLLLGAFVFNSVERSFIDTV